jgi:hypothetical protein
MSIEVKKQKKAVNAALSDIRKYRGEETQAEFWTRFGVTQSGGSRYESGRDMDKPLRTLIALDVCGLRDEVAAAMSMV